ncbi:MAG TPA: hypothetical protein VFL91_09135 [Thermomicrobiales bacterium]|nr:hypothetical protein [Thermomicrobiales bacterium]
MAERTLYYLRGLPVGRRGDRVAVAVATDAVRFAQGGLLGRRRRYALPLAAVRGVALRPLEGIEVARLRMWGQTGGVVRVPQALLVIRARAGEAAETVTLHGERAAVARLQATLAAALAGRDAAEAGR